MSPVLKRFVVKDAGVGITRKIRERWQVVDTAANVVVDEYKSKRAATMDARDRNRVGIPAQKWGN